MNQVRPDQGASTAPQNAEPSDPNLAQNKAVGEAVQAMRQNPFRRQVGQKAKAARKANAKEVQGDSAQPNRLFAILRGGVFGLLTAKNVKKKEESEEISRQLKEIEQKRQASNITPNQESNVEFSLMDFGKDKIETYENIKNMKDPLLISPKPSWASVRWINIDGISAESVHYIGAHYKLHTLIMEDICGLVNRPKLDFFEEKGNIFIISKMISIEDDDDTDIDEEIIFFFYDSSAQIIITFQEGRPGDVWADLRKRLSRPTSKVRQSGDALLETCYPIVEKFGTRMEDLEFKLLRNATPKLNEQVYHLKRELLFLRRSIWPLRDVVLQIISEDMPEDVIHEESKHFFRSINDRLLQINDMVEAYAELAIGLGGLYSNQQAQRMNNVMFVLTLVSAVFIPLTFVAGIYGMNFELIPELTWHYGYAYVWSIFVGLAAFILFLFWMKGWIGKQDSEDEDA